MLAQQQSRWTDAIVAAGSRYAIDNEQLQSEQRLVDEEIRAIDQQLSLLRQIEESLIIRADRRGVVDAWRLVERLDQRPLRRGDHLLQVIAENIHRGSSMRESSKIGLSHLNRCLRRRIDDLRRVDISSR